jgi:hypothetical protein
LGLGSFGIIFCFLSNIRNFWVMGGFQADDAKRKTVLKSRGG